MQQFTFSGNYNKGGGGVASAKIYMLLLYTLYTQYTKYNIKYRNQQDNRFCCVYRQPPCMQTITVNIAKLFNLTKKVMLS